MKIISFYKAFWIRSFEFKGRSTRNEYWWSYLANFIVYIALLFIDSLLGIKTASGEATSPLFAIYLIAQIVPTLSIQIRRLRDSGRNWPWFFIQLIPLIGGIWMLILLCQPSLPVA